MAVGFDYNLISRIQQANDIVDIVGEHLSLRRKGREMVGLCPFHDDHRPSLYVNPAKQIFKCFACGAGGDVLKFVQMRENLTFPQAVERLAQRAGIELPRTKTRAQQTAPSDGVDPNELARVNAWAAKLFQANLANGQKGKFAREYIAARRITPQSVKNWQLGLALATSDDLVNKAKAKDIPTKLLEAAGLVVGNQSPAGIIDKFVNRLMFPITDVTGRVIGFGGRAFDDTGAKYINSPATALFDKSSSLYGLTHARHQIVATGTAVIVEGYTDCIMAHQLSCNNVVAILGTSFTTGHGRILRRYAKKVVLLYDSDTAGIEAANRALEVCLAQHIDIELAFVPEGKDPCDFLLAAGKEPFDKIIEKAVNVFRFKWNRLINSFGPDQTVVDKKRAVEEFLQTIAIAMLAGNLSVVDKGLLVNQLSAILGIQSREINAELTRRIRTAARTASYQDPDSAQKQKMHSIDFGQGLAATAQREILEVVLNQPNLFAQVKKSITPEDFDVPILNQTAALIFETLNAEPKANLQTIIGGTDSVTVADAIVQLAQAGEEKGNLESRLAGALEALQRIKNKTITGDIKEVKDQKKYLRRLSETKDKGDPHNIGMI